MSDIVVRVENLSKEYRLGTISHGTLRQDIQSWWARMRGKEDPNSIIGIEQGAKSRALTPHSSGNDSLRYAPGSMRDNPHFLALDNVSFEVKQGEVLGIIGRNGAGKSTLLKILSGITAPTSGVVKIKGRVSSLLEVGTGFHPELTGRENVFLNGAILGMTRKEIEAKFDEILAFAEIERFIDTPVKRYSSGMYVRLAFAVAAHLEPEILIIDEVLAVGDASFQKKCLGKMGDVAKGGRTVLFVSHNMGAVKQLCSRGLVLHDGMIRDEGEIAFLVERYLRSMEKIEDAEDLRRRIAELPSDPTFRLENIRLLQKGKPVQNVMNADPLEIEICYEVLEKTTGLRIFFDLYDVENTLLFRSFHDETADGIPTMTPGRYLSKALIPANLLGPIKYELGIQAGIYNTRMCIPYSSIRIPLSVEATGHYNRAYVGDSFRGKLALAIDWKTNEMK